MSKVIPTPGPTGNVLARLFPKWAGTSPRPWPIPFTPLNRGFVLPICRAFKRLADWDGLRRRRTGTEAYWLNRVISPLEADNTGLATLEAAKEGIGAVDVLLGWFGTISGLASALVLGKPGICAAFGLQCGAPSITTPRDPREWVVVLLLAFVSATSLAFAAWHRRARNRRARETIKEVHVEKDERFRGDSLVLGADYLAEGFQITRLSRGWIAWSPRQTAWFLDYPNDGTIRLEVADEEYAPDRDFPHLWEMRAKIALRAIKDSKVFFDDIKASVATDVLGKAAPVGVVRVNRLRYSITQATAELVSKKYWRAKDGIVATTEYLLDRMVIHKEGAPNPSLELRPLGAIDLPRQLAGTILVVTRDPGILLVEQTANNKFGANQFSASGSGSFDWKDVSKKGDMDFVAWAEEAGTREFLEEAGLEPLCCGMSFQVISKLIGHALYLERGAKPELFFLAAINARYADILRISRKSRMERKLSKKLVFRELKPADGVGLPAALQSLCAKLRHPESGGEHRLSLSLETTLLMTEHVCQIRPQIVDQLISSVGMVPEAEPMGVARGA